jgi:uncharacterized protein
LSAAADFSGFDPAEIVVAGRALVCLPEGALFLAEERLLIVADLHLEKGSAYARRRVFLPPYDTAATLSRLAALVERTGAGTVVALGDSFHDRWAGERITACDREELARLQRGRTWLWIEGNHDRGGVNGLQGEHFPELRIGPLVLRHEPSGGASGAAAGEIAGHLHPVARIAGAGLSVRRRCFATDGARAVLPAFGAFAGGLNVCEPALAALFEPRRLCVHALGDRVYAVPRHRLLPG